MRWLISALIAFTVFVLVMLLLGKLLHENEAANADYVIKQKQAEQAKDEPKVERSETQEQRLQKVILDNLTCIDDSQCTLLALPGYSQSCLVAVNQIGAAQVNKLNLAVSFDKACDDKLKSSKAFCQLNLCSF